MPVTTTRYRNIYQFSEPLNLILPYSICLGVATIFVIIGIWSLIRNGVAAADGGFLQVMMATRGDTEMDRLVLEHGMIGANDVPQDLKDLKIRYGELVGRETTGARGEIRWGFGTIEETVSLKRRK